MEKITNYDIALTGLKQGKHEFDFKINQAFFTLFEIQQEFDNAELVAHAILQKHSTFFDLEITTSGKVDLICDISNETFAYPIESKIKVLIKFGETFDDSNEEIITIANNQVSFNAADIIYQTVILAIPMKKVDPNLPEEYLSILDKYSPKEIPEFPKEQEQETKSDPRWDALKNIRNKN